MLVADYKVAIDHKMMVRSIKTRQIKFLYCVYAFNQNYEYVGEQKEEKSSGDESSENKEAMEEEEDESSHYKVFTYDYLIKQILENCEDEAAQRIKQVADWRLKSTESFLKSMLMNR